MYHFFTAILGATQPDSCHRLRPPKLGMNARHAIAYACKEVRPVEGGGGSRERKRGVILGLGGEFWVGFTPPKVNLKT